MRGRRARALLAAAAALLVVLALPACDDCDCDDDDGPTGPGLPEPPAGRGLELVRVTGLRTRECGNDRFPCGLGVDVANVSSEPVAAWLRFEALDDGEVVGYSIVVVGPIAPGDVEERGGCVRRAPVVPFAALDGSVLRCARIDEVRLDRVQSFAGPGR